MKWVREIFLKTLQFQRTYNVLKINEVAVVYNEDYAQIIASIHSLTKPGCIVLKEFGAIA